MSTLKKCMLFDTKAGKAPRKNKTPSQRSLRNGVTTLDNAFARDQLLSDNACSAEHCPTAMVELHGLIFFLLLWILGPQVERVKAVVKFFFTIVVGKRGGKFMTRGHDPECGPEILHCRLREVTLHRRSKFSLTPVIEDRVKFLRNKHTQGRRHANTAVLNLCPTVLAKFFFIDIFGQSCRVPDTFARNAQWCGDTRHVFKSERRGFDDQVLTHFLQLGPGFMVQL